MLRVAKSQTNAVTPGDMTNSSIATQAKEALFRHVLEPLLPRCVDCEYGGLLVDFDERWRAVGPHDKSLEHAARTTSAFALLARTNLGVGCEQLARHGCEFLKQAMWDHVHGGFFARVDRAGRPLWDGLKHPHGVTYAVQAFLLAEPYLDQGEGLAWAEQAFAWLEEVAWDPSYGGYWGSFRRNNERYPAGARLPTPDGRDILGSTSGFKEINTQSDAIEMLTLLVERRVGKHCVDRLTELVNLLTERLIDPSGVVAYLWRPDWRPAQFLVRVGYHFMTARRLVQAAAAMGNGEALIARACELVDFCLASARHPLGGFCLAVSTDGRTWPETGPSSDLRQWWVQLEAVHALHRLAHEPSAGHDARARYRRARDQQWYFTLEYLFDRRNGGIRELPLDRKPRWRRALSRWLGRDPGATPVQKTHCWKDPLHEVETFLTLSRLT